MNNKELFRMAEETFQDCLKIMKDKNHDYATKGVVDDDALKNFKLVEYLGITDAQTGVLVRMCDKISRLANTYKGGQKVNESCDDTTRDLINYAVILHALRKEQNE